MTHLKTCDNDTFFDELDKVLEVKVPTQIKNILKINCYASAFAMSRFDDSCFSEIEHFMKNVFRETMITEGEEKKDYLGIFTADQAKFIFVGGQKVVIKAIAEYCASLYKEQNIDPLETNDNQSSAPSRSVVPSRPSIECNFQVIKNICSIQI